MGVKLQKNPNLTEDELHVNQWQPYDDNDSDIIHNPTRKVLTNEELAEKQAKKGKKKNDYNLD